MVVFERFLNIFVGITGVLLAFWANGLLNQNLITQKFVNNKTNQEDKFKYMMALVLMPSLTTWAMGSIYNIRLENRVKIPAKNSLICAGFVFMSGYTLNKAATMTSYPVVMTVKSSSILAVLLVAVLCTRVRDHTLNLPAKKIILGIIITVGVFIFGFFDPQKKQRETQTELLGFGLLLISLLADGFLPDFQAVIKAEYKPQPTEMMAEINKYIALISLVFSLFNFEIWDIILFIFYHPKFALILFLFCITSFIGQIFIYRLIKQFRQHIVPFVVTIRKILTVIINIIYFKHQISILQIVGIIIVVGASIFEFVLQITKVPEQQKISNLQSTSTNIANQQFSQNQTLQQPSEQLENTQQKIEVNKE